MAELLRTALYAEHQRQSATFTSFGGWDMPLRFGSDRGEHEAVRTHAGIFDLSHMAQIEVEGPHAAHVLDHSLTGLPSALEVGQARYMLILATDAGIIDDLIVYRIASSHFLVVANAANRLDVVDELTARSMALKQSQVSICDTTVHRSLIAVQGPESTSVVSQILPAADRERFAKLRYYRMMEVRVQDLPIRIARTGYTGECGYELMLPAAGAVDVWRQLIHSGQEYGLTRCGLAARDTLRLEAGMALYGHELDRSISPLDAGLGSTVVDHTFVGATALSERPVAWNLYGLIGQGRRAARAGCNVYAGGDLVGTITSGVLSPTLGRPIALARLVPNLPAGTYHVDVRGKLQPMETVDLPFYSRNRSSHTHS